MIVLEPDNLSAFAGHRYPWILQDVFAQQQDVALTRKLSLLSVTSPPGSEGPGWMRRERCSFFQTAECSTDQSVCLFPRIVSLCSLLLTGPWLSVHRWKARQEVLLSLLRAAEMPRACREP